MIRYRLNGYSTADWNERNVSDGHARNVLIEPLITWREYDVQVKIIGGFMWSDDSGHLRHLLIIVRVHKFYWITSK